MRSGRLSFFPRNGTERPVCSVWRHPQENRPENVIACNLSAIHSPVSCFPDSFLFGEAEYRVSLFKRKAGNGKPFSVKQPGNDWHLAGQDTAESANMVHGRTRKGQGPDSVPALSPGSLCRIKSVDSFDFMLDIQ